MFDPINTFKALDSGIIGLSLIIDSVVYDLVAKAFGLFVELAKNSIFGNDIINDIMYKCYALVGIIMLFVLAFAIIQNIVNPENAFSGDKGMGKVVTNIVKALILVALVPVIFDLGYNIQNAIIKDDIFGKIFINEGDYNVEANLTGDSEEEIDESSIETIQKEIEGDDILILEGNQLAFSVYNGFINPEKAGPYEIDAGEFESEAAFSGTIRNVACILGGIGGAVLIISVAFTGGATLPLTIASVSALAACKIALEYNLTMNMINFYSLEHHSWAASVARALSGDFKGFTPFVNVIAEGNMTYMPFISWIVGLVLLYITFSFCLDLGVRAVKLAFYEMIAPIPIFLSILPGKSDLLKNWTKAVLTTFMEIIMRLLIIYLIIYFSSHVTLAISGSVLTQAIVIMGIVVFAKQLPKYISEITGIDSGNMKLGIKEKLAEGGLFTAAAFVGGGLLAGANRFNRTLKGPNGNFGKALKAGIIGAGSGAVRAGYNARGAKSFSESKDAIKNSKKAVLDKATKRANYKANHPDGVFLGHATDLISSAGRGLGILNTSEDLAAQIKLIDQVDDAISKVKDVSKEQLEKDAKKGKNIDYGITTEWSYEIGGKKIENIKFTSENYKKILDAIEAARPSGSYNGLTFSQWQDVASNYSNEMGTAMANLSFLSETEFNKLDKKNQIALSKSRQAAENAKAIGREAAANSVISKTGLKAEHFRSDASFNLKEPIIDNALSNEMPYERMQLNSEYAKLKREEEKAESK